MSGVKIAVVIYEPLDSDTSRVYRGLKTALEFKDAGDDIVVVFDGSGVKSLAAISDPKHKMNPLAVACTTTSGAPAHSASHPTGSPTPSRPAGGRCLRSTRAKQVSVLSPSRATRSSTSKHHARPSFPTMNWSSHGPDSSS